MKAIVHGFFKIWLRNHPKFLLHFLIHIDVLMLCRKFELILTSIFQVTTILRKHQKSKKYPRLFMFFFKWLLNHPKFLLHFFRLSKSKLGQKPVLCGHSLWPNFTKNNKKKNFQFYNFFEAYTCTPVA